MKIAIIIRFLRVSGGGERQAIMLARELKRMGHDVCFYTFSYDKNACFPELLPGLRVVALDNAKKLAFKIDRDTEILNSHDQISVQVAYYFKKYIKDIPSVLMLNDLHIASWSLFEDPLFNPPRRPLVKKIFNWLRDTYENLRFFSSQDKIIVLNERTVFLVRKYLHRKAFVVRSGVDRDRFIYKERNPIAAKRINILCNGIFYIHRRFEDVISAVKILLDGQYDPYLKIIGDYQHKDTARSYYNKLVKMVEGLGLTKRITFSGVVSDAELTDSYQGADVFVFASHRQTWGLAVFEAMSSGLPVIVSRTAGASEVLTDNENALLVDPASPFNIATAIKKMVENPEIYKKLSKNGSEFVRQNISWSNYASNMLRFFQEAIREKKK